jgi:hypothetical protein
MKSLFKVLSIFILLIVMVQAAAAQPVEPPIYTQFAVGCIERLGDLHYRIHFGYASDGVEAFTVGFTNPNNGTAFINAPGRFSTSPGEHDDWYLDGHSEDSPYTFGVTFTSEAGVHTLDLHTWDVPACTDGQYPDIVPVTPEPVVGNCPAWSYESATGNVICLWDLPYAKDGP